ncbi:hypothetical protein L9F63_022096, partial [Diploptera punctata]
LHVTNLHFKTTLAPGGIAGLTVDVTLFPLDTLKTRLQSPCGFKASGGFKNLYKGVGIAAIGSIPTASLFFCVYNTLKSTMEENMEIKYRPFIHMSCASLAEVGSCMLKVPIEIVKQRQQASKIKLSPIHICRKAIELEGYLGLYRGFTTTVLREIPFALIQFTTWEWMKQEWRSYSKKDIGVAEVAVFGALSGGIAAGTTTPLDVAKTRIMLAEKLNGSTNGSEKLRTSMMIASIFREKGVRGLFIGFIPRTLWMTLGGAIFFGAYQTSVEVLMND